MVHKAYNCPYHFGLTVQFQAFDEDYVRRLRDGDPQTEQHFAAYFGELIYLKLRRRVHSRQLQEDIRHDTLCRVLRAIRQKNGLEDPRKFGAYVSGVCHYVTVELSRSESRYEPAERNLEEQRDTTQDPDAPLVNAQRRELVTKVLSRLEERDRRLLRAVFLDELGSKEVCRRFQVEPDYLRVLLFRAKARFRQAYARGVGSVG